MIADLRSLPDDERRTAFTFILNAMPKIFAAHFTRSMKHSEADLDLYERLVPGKRAELEKNNAELEAKAERLEEEGYHEGERAVKIARIIEGWFA